jgi:hypothetical protein
MRWICAVVALGAGAAGAQVDNAMQFVVSNRVSDRYSSCTVLVEALWNPLGVQFGGAKFDVFADADPGEFSEPAHLISGPGTTDGVVELDGDSVTGIVSGRLCFPLDPPCDPGPCPNPEAIWVVTWSTADFTPRIVNLSTATSKFFVYVEECQSLDPDEVQEGAGQIVITCYADCDQSTGLGALDVFDFFCFINAFDAGSVEADCIQDGVFDLFDFVCFINEFNIGC